MSESTSLKDWPIGIMEDCKVYLNTTGIPGDVWEGKGYSIYDGDTVYLHKPNLKTKKGRKAFADWVNAHMGPTA